MYQMNEIDHSMKSTLSGPGISTTSTSSTSAKTINNNNLHYNQNTLNYSTTTSSSNEILDENPVNRKAKYIPIGISSSSSSSSVPNSISKQPQFLQKESNNNSISNTATTTTTNGKSTKDEHKYGKIQAINKYIDKYRIADRYNGNTAEDFSHIDNGNNTTINKQSIANNNIDKFGKNINCQLMSNNSIKSNSENNNRSFLGGCGNQITQQQQLTNNAKYRNGNGNLIVGNPNTNLQPNTNGTGLTATPHPPNHHHLQGYHVVNHVSSPESAYSTGYSTDGTSPGKSFCII